MLARSATARLPVKIAAPVAENAGEAFCLSAGAPEWRAVTWPISWPSTAASSASELRYAMMPARDVDVAARQREGVDVLGVDDREVPLELGTLAGLREFVADLVDVILQRLVFVDAVELDDLLVRLAALLDSPFLETIVTSVLPVTGLLARN